MSPRIIQLGDEIPAGIEAVAGDLRAGRTGLWIGRGPAGFALLVGTHRLQDVSSGKVAAVSLTPTGLRLLYDRIGALLDEQLDRRKVTALDGIEIGNKPSGD